MPFPNHDRYWTDVVRWLKDRHRAEESLMAPDEFVEHFPVVLAYAASFDAGRGPSDWIAIHKGKLDSLRPGFLDDIRRRHHAAFANEVFVVLTSVDRSTGSCR